jgi:transcriptional regulator with XRE-family HTH domain
MDFSILYVSGRQIRAARDALGLDRAALARESGVSIHAIKYLERSTGRQCTTSVQNLASVLETLAKHGVSFSGTSFTYQPKQVA